MQIRVCKLIIYFFKYFKTSCPRTRKQQNNGLRVLKGTKKIIKEMGGLEGQVRSKGRRQHNNNFGAVPKPLEITDYDYIN